MGLLLLSVIDACPNQLIVSYSEGEPRCLVRTLSRRSNLGGQTISQVVREGKMGLTTEERNAIYNRKREYSLSGNPMEAMYLQRALDADELPDPTLMTDSGIKTDIPLAGGVEVEIPPRHGKGSGIGAWRKFAALVTDIDTDVLARMTKRDDIIKMLAARGNIPDE